MAESGFVDYYELLQISPNAEPETVNRVFNKLAQRYHPDNPETGDTHALPAAQSGFRHARPIAEKWRSSYDSLYQEHRTPY